MGADLDHIFRRKGPWSLHYRHKHFFHPFPIQRIYNMAVMNGMRFRRGKRDTAVKQWSYLGNGLRSANPDNRNSSLAQRRRYGGNGVTKHVVIHLWLNLYLYICSKKQ
jgi:hypothetical protein